MCAVAQGCLLEDGRPSPGAASELKEWIASRAHNSGLATSNHRHHRVIEVSGEGGAASASVHVLAVHAHNMTHPAIAAGCSRIQRAGQGACRGGQSYHVVCGACTCVRNPGGPEPCIIIPSPLLPTPLTPPPALAAGAQARAAAAAALEDLDDLEETIPMFG